MVVSSQWWMSQVENRQFLWWSWQHLQIFLDLFSLFEFCLFVFRKYLPDYHAIFPMTFSVLWVAKWNMKRTVPEENISWLGKIGLGLLTLKKNPTTWRCNNLREFKIGRKSFEIFFLLLREQLKMPLWKQWRKQYIFATHRMIQNPGKLWPFFTQFLLTSHFYLISYFDSVP